jgi:hypothetical protein
MARSCFLVCILTLWSAALLAFGLLPTASAAADDIWDGNGDGVWSDGTRWSLGRPPTSTDAALISGSFAQTVTLNSPANHAQTLDIAGRATLSNPLNTTLEVTGNVDVHGAYSLTGGTLNAAQENIRRSIFLFGGGIFDHTGGLNNVRGGGNLSVGGGGLNVGTYNLSGSGVLKAALENIGVDLGFGTFNQSNGVHTVQSVLSVGVRSGEGTYNLSDNGLLTVGSLALGGIAEFIGAGGLGTFNQAGGVHTVSSGSGEGIPPLQIGIGGGNGTYNLSGGRLAVSGGGPLWVGSGGTGTVTQSGGFLVVDGDEVIGLRGGSGTFTQSGGTNFTSNLYLGNGGVGVYTLTRGSLFAELETINTSGSTFNVAGGDFASTFHQNFGQLNYSAGSFNSNLVNDGIINLSGEGTRIINGDVTNEPDGLIKLTDTSVKFAGTVTDAGLIKSDPATSLFNTLVIRKTGVLQGGRGDVLSISGDFLNHSMQNMLWDTGLATLRFAGPGEHEFDLAGRDFGPGPAGFFDNFAFGDLTFDPGVILELVDGNNTPGAALYIRELDLPGQDLSLLADIHSAFNIYYDEFDPANAYLGGLDFQLPGGGFLVAATTTPEPASLALLTSMLACLLLLRTIRKDAGFCRGGELASRADRVCLLRPGIDRASVLKTRQPLRHFVSIWASEHLIARTTVLH